MIIVISIDKQKNIITYNCKIVLSNYTIYRIGEIIWIEHESFLYRRSKQLTDEEKIELL